MKRCEKYIDIEANTGYPSPNRCPRDAEDKLDDIWYCMTHLQQEIAFRKIKAESYGDH